MGAASRSAFVFVFFFATMARADRVAAEKLFDEGRSAMQRGEYALACAKFEESDKADPAVGTQMNLAMCWEKLGKTASAWAMYMQVANASTSAGRDARTQFATQHAAALLPTLSKLTITAPAGTSIRVDGVVWSAAATGIATPVDPGRHVIDATTPGKPAFHSVVMVPANAASLTVAVTF